MRIPSGAPDVSVIMSVRNAQRFVEAGVHSVLAQSHANFELLAIDDASTDATPQILDRLAATDGRIRVLRDGRLGLVGALNRGLAEARRWSPAWTPTTSRCLAGSNCRWRPWRPCRNSA